MSGEITVTETPVQVTVTDTVVNLSVTPTTVNVSTTNQGAQGATGVAGQINSVSATTLPAGSSATVVNNGTSSNAQLVFGIPTGATGASGVVNVTAPITNSGTSTAANIGINQSALSIASSQITDKAAANGVASLDSSGLVPSSQIPPIAITDTFVVASQAAMLALNAQTGDIAIRTDINTTFILQSTPASTLANWKQILTPAQVQSVDGRTGVVTLSDLYDASGAAATAQATAISTASADATTKANTAQTNANSYTDTKIAAEVTRANGAYDATGAASTVQTNLNTHTGATTAHGSTALNTAGAIVQRDSSNNINVTSVNSTPIPSSTTLLTPSSSLDPTKLSAGTAGISITGSAASATGNAATATKLQTARNINGVAFDGTAPITVTADASTLTGTTLNSTVVNSSLTKVGALSGGTAGIVSADATGNLSASQSISVSGNIATSANVNANTVNSTNTFSVGSISLYGNIAPPTTTSARVNSLPNTSGVLLNDQSVIPAANISGTAVTLDDLLVKMFGYPSSGYDTFPRQSIINNNLSFTNGQAMYTLFTPMKTVTVSTVTSQTNQGRLDQGYTAAYRGIGLYQCSGTNNTTLTPLAVTPDIDKYIWANANSVPPTTSTGVSVTASNVGTLWTLLTCTGSMTGVNSYATGQWVTITGTAGSPGFSSCAGLVVGNPSTTSWTLQVSGMNAYVGTMTNGTGTGNTLSPSTVTSATASVASGTGTVATVNVTTNSLANKFSPYQWVNVVGSNFNMSGIVAESPLPTATTFTLLCPSTRTSGSLGTITSVVCPDSYGRYVRPLYTPTASGTGVTTTTSVTLNAGTTYALGFLAYSTGGTFGSVAIAGASSSSSNQMIAPYLSLGLTNQTTITNAAITGGTISSASPWGRLT